MSGEKKSFFKKASKTFGRQQEKFMQMLGKHESVEDEEFNESCANFNQQQTHALRLQKEASAYLRALKAFATASKNLGDALKAVYDSEWENSEEVYTTVEAKEHMFIDLQEKVESQVVDPLTGYVQRFPDIKARISKRERRALDFNRAKHALEAAKSKDHSKNPQKIQQLEETYDLTQSSFEEINTECRQTLPSFFNSRVGFYASTFQSLFAAEHIFHAAVSQMSDSLAGVMDNMMESQSQIISTTAPTMRSIDSSKGDYVDDADIQSIISSQPDSKPTAAPRQYTPADLAREIAEDSSEEDSDGEITPAPTQENGHGESTTDSPLLRKAVHAYEPTDEDELALQPDDIVEVLPFPDPEDQDDGWLYGRCNGNEGVFPENHTVPYET